MSHERSSSSGSRSFIPNALAKFGGASDVPDDKTGPLGLITLATPQWGPANADLIFVHGLGGGSRKTWSKSSDPSLYWPKEWLPNDEAFRDVRIHSFGYDSDWGRKSILGIHDFANALLGSILDCPVIPRDTNAPIIFIGHSMGGLVIKRAYLLAKGNQHFASLAARIQGILFLATPHRGSDMAQVLSKLLILMGGHRPYVTDLGRDSQTINSINDEFPEQCQDLLLYSFYETLPTNFAVKRSLIVERDLATMGYANERRAYLVATHREVCKYSSTKDSNYQTVRNALEAVLSILRTRFTSSKREISDERRRLLDMLLGVSDAPEDDFLSADSLRMDGSVEWLIHKETFQEWLHYANSPIYCITAKPATGKTILSGKVIAHLRKLKKCCNFYFFRHDTKDKSSVTSFLLSMAWQMAHSDERVLNVCLEVLEKDNNFQMDSRYIWRKLYLEGIFKIAFEHIHYWVIDALDECKNEAEIISLLLKAAEVSSIHIFLTSRNKFETRQKLGDLRVGVLPEAILEEDSKSDIRMYLEANMDALSTSDEHDQQRMVYQILDKSRGCFLWVSLVVQELRNAHTSTDKQRILDEVPTDMGDLYSRILDTMSTAIYGKELAKAILTWTVCSTRPLKIAELHEALQLDLKVSTDSVEKSIQSSCGQLVYIDANDQVQITHLTARDFLLSARTKSEFAIDGKAGHRRLLLTCLQYLTGDEMKGPGHRRLSGNTVPKERSAFISYASNSLGEHISRVPWTDKDIVSCLAKFFNSSNVLSWIEYIAKHSDQQRLVEVGKALGTNLQESTDRELSSLTELALLSSWATDLVRLVMQFGRNLEAYPASIFRLIPPFFPAETAIRKQFGSSARNITVRGLRAETWDDCLAIIVETHEQYSSLACSKTQFAIGYFSGKISVYKQTTCQQVAVLQHGEPVRLLKFGEKGDLLVSASSKSIHIWDLASRALVRKFDAPQQCMALVLDDEDRLLLGAMKDHRLKYWDLDSEGPAEDVNWTQNLEAMTIRLYRRPVTAAFGMDTDLLAIIYKGQDILLWGLDTNSIYDIYSRDSGASAESSGRPYGSSGVRCLVFGNASTAHLLACAYTDGELVLFDTFTGEVKQRVVAFAHILACSADGSTLATADPSGAIQLLEMETLQLLYRINSVEPGIQGLAFSGDGLRLHDIRGSRCRIWDLTHLLRRDVHHKFSPTVSQVPEKVSLEPSDDTVLVTSIACHDDGQVFFCGKDDGSVHIYDIESGLPIRELFSHAHGVTILFLCYERQSNTLASVDSSSRVMIHRLSHQHQSIVATDILFNHRVDIAVYQLLCQPGLDRVLVCSRDSAMLWSISPNGNTLLSTIEYEDNQPCQWTNHPLVLDQLISITHNTAHVYNWKIFQRLTEAPGIQLEGSILPELAIRSITPCFNGTILATTFSPSHSPHSKSKLVLWNTSDFTPTSTHAVPVPSYRSLSDKVEVLIGTTDSGPNQSERLIFLHGNHWICAADAESARANRFARHFFFPADWLSTKKNLDLNIKVTKLGDIILVKDDEVAVVRRGLLTSELADEGSLHPAAAAGKLPLVSRRARRLHA